MKIQIKLKSSENKLKISINKTVQSHKMYDELVIVEDKSKNNSLFLSEQNDLFEILTRLDLNPDIVENLLIMISYYLFKEKDSSVLICINKDEKINNKIDKIIDLWKDRKDITIWEDDKYYFFSGNDLAALMAIINTLTQKKRCLI